MALKPGPLRDAIVLVVVFAVLLGGLYLYTQTWPPAVIVESSSMMHPDNEVSYGRIGTIDPGDLVLVKNVSSPADVETLLEGGPHHYGKSGDVVVYFPRNNRGITPIIHRAVAYVEVTGSGADKRYHVRWNPAAACEGGATKDAADPHWCVYDARGIYAPSVPIGAGNAGNPSPYRPDEDPFYATSGAQPFTSGFLTKGDNPVTNPSIDQVSLLSPPVQLSWIEGKGRGEVPWLGLIKLSLAGKVNERNPPRDPRTGEILWVKIGSAYAPKDLWVMLAVSLFVLVGVPLLWDGYKAVQARRTRSGAGASTGPRGGPPRPPIDVAPGRVTLTFVELTWHAPPDAANVHEYRIYRDATLVGSTRTTTFTDAGLEPGHSYSYAVASADAHGSESARVGDVLVKTMDRPTAPG